MDILTRDSLVTMVEQVEQTIFEYLKPGIGLVTVSVHFKRSRLLNMPGGFSTSYEVYSHIAGKEETFVRGEEFMILDIVNEAVRRIDALAENFQVVRTA